MNDDHEETMSIQFIQLYRSTLNETKFKDLTERDLQIYFELNKFYPHLPKCYTVGQ